MIIVIRILILIMKGNTKDNKSNNNIKKIGMITLLLIMRAIPLLVLLFI